MNYSHSMIIQWSDEDKCYLVHLPELPWQQQYHTYGVTYAEDAKPRTQINSEF